MKPWCVFLDALLIVVLLAACQAGTTLNRSSDVPSDEKIPTTRTITETVPVTISYKEYLDNPDEYSLMRANVTGRIVYDVKLAQGNAGVYARFIVDDGGRRVELVGVPTSQYDLFPPKEPSEELYAVTGTFKVYYDGLVINVKTLTPTTRGTETVTRTVTE